MFCFPQNPVKSKIKMKKAESLLLHPHQLVNNPESEQDSLTCSCSAISSDDVLHAGGKIYEV